MTTGNPMCRWDIRQGRFFTVIALFIIEALLFSWGRSEISTVLFGADAIQMTQLQDDAFALSAGNIPDIKAFARRLTQADTTHDVPAAFVFGRMLADGQDAAHRLASGTDEAKSVTAFLLSLNRDLVDFPTPWPKPLTTGLSLPTDAHPESFRTTNLQLLARHFGLVGVSFSERIPHLLPIGLFSEDAFKAMSQWMRVIRGVFDSDRQNNRYTPLSELYGILGQNIMLGLPNGERIVLGMAAITYSLTWTMVFMLARRLIGSVPWAIFAVAFAQLAPASLAASYALFSLPYLLVVLITAAALTGYLAYREDGSRSALAFFVMMAILGPWTREFGSAIAFIVVACEILRFNRQKSPAILAICLPLIGHAIYPSFFPWLVGVSTGPVIAVFSQGKVAEQLNPLQLHFAFVAIQFVQFPPMLWAVLVGAIATAVWGVSQCQLWRWTLKIVWLSRGMACTYVVLAGLFLFAFANPGVGHEFDHPHWAYHDRPAIAIMMLVFLIVSILSGFRFGVVAPVYFLAMFIPFLRLNLAEIHMVFTAPAAAVILTQWLRDFAARFADQNGRWQKTALASVLVVVALDQSLNAVATIRGQKALVDAHLRIADDIRRLIPRYSIIVTNFLAHPDIFYYSGFYFAPYQTTHNNPMGPKHTVFEKADMARLINANRGLRDIYFLEATPAYAPWRAAYHSHKWVHEPPGPLHQMAEYPVEVSYGYLDAFKRLTPTNFVSLPAYMDWETDLSAANSDRAFVRQLKTRYVLYRLTPDPNALK